MHNAIYARLGEIETSYAKDILYPPPQMKLFLWFYIKIPPIEMCSAQFLFVSVSIPICAFSMYPNNCLMIVLFMGLMHENCCILQHLEIWDAETILVNITEYSNWNN